MKKAPTGEDILNEAIEETNKDPVSTPLKQTTMRSSLSSISKVMAKPSPAKPPEEVKATATPAKSIPGLSRMSTTAATAAGGSRLQRMGTV